jgi:hypothetical protein
MGSKKTVEKNDPWAPAQPYILDNLATTKATFDANQPGLQDAALMQQGTYGRLAPGAEQGIMGAQSLVNRNLAGDNLRGNPFLDGILDSTRSNVTNQVNSQFNRAGRFGSGRYEGVLARELARAENDLRFQNYGAERQIQQNSIGDAQNLMGGTTGLLNNAAQLPWIGVQAQNGGTNSLTNGFGVRTTTESGGLGSVLGGLAGTLGGAAISKYSDERVKNITGRAGTDPKTGLPLYDYTYKDDPTGTPQTGVMAQDVEKVAPEAVGQDASGVKMVDYGALGMPDPAQLASLKQDIPDLQPRKFSLGNFIGDLTRPGEAGIGDTLSLVGESLLAGAGGGWSNVGRGLLAARQQRFDRADTNRQLDIREREAGALEAWRRTQTERADAPPQPTAGLRSWQEWNSLPPSQREAARPFFTGASLDPNVQRPLIDMRGRQQEDLARLRSDLRPTPAARAPSVRATKVVNGRAYYNIGGRWFDNPEGL